MSAYQVETQITQTQTSPEYKEESPNLGYPKKDTEEQKDLFSDTTSSQCPECDVVFTKRLYMFRHYKRKHENLKYSCDQCDYRSKTKQHLIQHSESQHEGIKFSCNYCDHQATRKTHLKTHVQAKHNDIIEKSLNEKLVVEKRPAANKKVNQDKANMPAGKSEKELFVKCPDCEGVFASRRFMLTHHKARHEVNLSDLIMSCDQCDYQTKWTSNYHRHRRTHNVEV